MSGGIGGVACVFNVHDSVCVGDVVCLCDCVGDGSERETVGL